MPNPRRKSTRIKISLQAIDNDTEKKIGDIQDISITGCFVETDSPRPLDSTIDIKFINQTDLEDISIRGRIVSHRSDPSGMGVEFYAMPPEYRTILRNFIKKEIGTVQITDRRRSMRVDLALFIFTQSGEKIGVTQNISADGFLLRSDLELNENAEVDIKFTLPNTKKLILTKAIVNRIQPKAFALNFTSILPQDRQELKMFIKDLADDILI